MSADSPGPNSLREEFARFRSSEPPRPARPQRDGTFLVMAAIAAAGGLLSVVFAIGVPLYDVLHGRAVHSAVFLFSCWGFAALGGAVACYRTYLTSAVSPPPRPPRGGLRVIEGGGVRPTRSEPPAKDSFAA